MIRIFNEQIQLPECTKCKGSFWKRDENGQVVEVDGNPQRCECYYPNLLLDANIGFDYWTVEPGNFAGDRADLDQIVDYLSQLDDLKAQGRGFYIYGPNYGVGKTTLAMMLLKRALRQGYSCLFVPFSDLVILNTKYINIHDKVVEQKIEYIKNVDFLVLDDLAKEYDNQRDNGRATLNSILRYRDLYRKPTIYTSNVPITQVAELYGGSNYSVIYGRSILITMKNTEDYRRKRKTHLAREDKKKKSKITPEEIMAG